MSFCEALFSLLVGVETRQFFFPSLLEDMLVSIPFPSTTLMGGVKLIVIEAKCFDFILKDGGNAFFFQIMKRG